MLSLMKAMGWGRMVVIMGRGERLDRSTEGVIAVRIRKHWSNHHDSGTRVFETDTEKILSQFVQ